MHSELQWSPALLYRECVFVTLGPLKNTVVSPALPLPSHFLTHSSFSVSATEAEKERLVSHFPFYLGIVLHEILAKNA